MPKELKTGWVNIATSGPSIDGREIKKEWLTDMAKYYSPSLYSARLWPDHLRFFGPLGKVLALKTQPAVDPELEGEIHLAAILAPSGELIEANSKGWYTHTSIEVKEQFRGKEYTYLAGLGVTDIPASVGTDELRFSERVDPGTILLPGNTIDLSEAIVRERPFFSLPGLSLFGGGKDNSQQEDDAMNEEQFKQFMAAMSAQTAAFTELKDKLTAAPAAPAQKADEGEAKTVSAEEFNSLKESFAALTNQHTELEKQFKEALNAKPGTQADEGDGGATEETL